MGNSLNLNAKFFVQILAMIAAFANFSSFAFAGGNTPTTVPDFFSVIPQPTPAHSVADLNTIFVTGVGPYNSTMSGNIYPYNLPQNGVFNNSLYNGCYDSKNNRLNDLDADLSCTSTIAAKPDISVFRLFLGYKIGCEGTPNPVTGICDDTSILMNCEYKQVQIGKGPFDAAIATRNCTKGNPIIRRAKANNLTAVINGCLPGQDGSTYPYCTPCGNSFYNDAVGENKGKCTACSVYSLTNATDPGSAETILGAKSLPTKFKTPPPVTTGSSKTGATGASQCQIDDTDTWECKDNFIKTLDNQHCVPAPPCNLHLSIVPTSPTNGSNGSILATYSGETGTVTAFQITPPPTNPPSFSGKTGTFSGLAGAKYTVTATDSACTTSTDITLAPPATCGLTVAIFGTVFPTPSNPSGGTFTAKSMNAVGAVMYTINPVQGTMAPSGSNVTVTGLTAGSYTLTATDTGVPGCTVTTPVNLSCSLTLAISGIANPTWTSPTGGSFNGVASNAIGPVTFSLSPALGTMTPSGSSIAVTGLSAGNYTLTATDTGATGCTASQVATIGKPVCDPIATVSTPTTKVVCTWSCATDFWNVGVRTGYISDGETCSSLSAINRRNNGSGCTGMTATSCQATGVSPAVNGIPQTCRSVQLGGTTPGVCPGAKTRVQLRDSSAVIAYDRDYAGGTSGTPCINDSGVDVYVACGSTNSPGTVGTDSFGYCNNPDSEYGLVTNGQPYCP